MFNKKIKKESHAHEDENLPKKTYFPSKLKLQITPSEN